MLEGRDMGSVREHTQLRAAKGHAASVALLAAHPCPRAFRTLYRHFRAIGDWRGAGSMGAAALTLADVREYETRFGVRFLPGELDLLKCLDGIALSPAGA